MKLIVLQTGHWGIENITSEGLRSWRDWNYLKRSTGAAGERDYFHNLVIPKLTEKLIAAGIQVYIAGATFAPPEAYNRSHDLWISFHCDAGGIGDRCMISAPNRDTQPAYLHQTAQSESERFCQVWKSIYPAITGVTFNPMVTDGMKDYYAYDYVNYDTPAVLIEHFNATSPRGMELKNNPDLVVDGDFKAIINFLGISETPPVIKEVWQIVYKNQVLQEYEFNPTDRINELAGKLEISQGQVADFTAKNATLLADLQDGQTTLSEVRAQLTKACEERDTAKTAVADLDRKLTTANTKIAGLEKKIEDLEKADPIAAYTGFELIGKGITKLLGKREVR